ncbi:MAG: DUF72 domain-containing protein [Pseudomonadota bacterium]|nr:DUF72 domain-containing protein [Pseudomonadota bacterium]
MRIGCAGWSLPKPVRDAFGEGDSALARYATRFDAVEINSSFYRPHLPTTYARWAASVPGNFRFSVKLPRAITHDARLVGVSSLLSRFVDEVNALGGRLGPLLVQLPPSLVWQKGPAGTFFRMLQRRHHGHVACEPRHASWFTTEASALLAHHGIARVAADPAPVPQGGAPGGTTEWQYWRLHGSPRIYYSDYDASALHVYKQRLVEPSAAIERWCIFDNTAHGHATSNALSMRAALPKRRGGRK